MIEFLIGAIPPTALWAINALVWRWEREALEQILKTEQEISDNWKRIALKYCEEYFRKTGETFLK